METKFKIIETDDYVLAVSDEEIEKWYLDNVGTVRKGVIWDKEYWSVREDYKKIIAYQPKGNAPELDLPLLPKMVVEDDVKKKENRKICKCRRAYENPLSEICSLCWNELYPDEKDEVKEDDLIDSKSTTKIYSEEDLKEAFLSGCHNMSDYIEGESESDDYDIYKEADNYIQSLKTPTHKWFVAETVCDQCLDDKTTDSCYCHFGNYKIVLKTTTINNKTYLVGTYLFE